MNYAFSKIYEGKMSFIQIFTVEVMFLFAELDHFIEVSASELFVCHTAFSWFLTLSLCGIEDYLAY